MDQKNTAVIKIWSVVVGVLSLSSLTILAAYPLFSFVGLLSAVAIVLGLATTYAGMQVSSMSLKTVNGIFRVKFAWLIVNFLFSITVTINFTRLIIIVAQSVIVWFLIQDLKKLSSTHKSLTN